MLLEFDAKPRIVWTELARLGKCSRESLPRIVIEGACATGLVDDSRGVLLMQGQGGPEPTVGHDPIVTPQAGDPMHHPSAPPHPGQELAAPPGRAFGPDFVHVAESDQDLDEFLMDGFLYQAHLGPNDDLNPVSV
jgi:hypothetical protein